MSKGMKYNIVYEGGQPESVTAHRRGKMYVAQKDHPNFGLIIHALETERPHKEVIDLFDTSGTFRKGFRFAAKAIKAVLGTEGDATPEAKQEEAELIKIAEDLGVRNGTLHFKGEPLHGALAETILSLHEQQAKEAFVPFVKFLRKVMTNPNEHSREHLFNWMRHLSFNITEEGDVVAYKGVRRDKEHGFVSTTAGPAICAGKPHTTGYVPNVIGTVVEMARDSVTFDPARGCAAGLHVGTLSFARGFGSAIIEVIIDPRDVVSVPTDSNWQKMRVCKYYIVKEVSNKEVRVLSSSKPVVATAGDRE